MKIVLNGKERVCSPNQKTVAALLSEQGFDLNEMVAIQLNGRILKSPELDVIVVKNQDRIELLYHFGGGSVSLCDN